MRCFFISLLFASSMSFANVEVPKLKLIQLSDNVYQHISYKDVGSYGMVGASGLVVVDGDNAHIIDTPWTAEDTKKLVTWIKEKNLKLKSALVTHFHEDASGGLSFLNQLKIKTYATSLTNKLLSLAQREEANSDISSQAFQIVKNKIEVFYPGAGHSKDNVVVWLANEKTLFGGCFVKSLNSNGLGYTGDASLPDWPHSIDNVIQRYPEIKVVIPGHGKVGSLNLLNHTKQLLLNKK